MCGRGEFTDQGKDLAQKHGAEGKGMTQVVDAGINESARFLTQTGAFFIEDGWQRRFRTIASTLRRAETVRAQSPSLRQPQFSNALPPPLAALETPGSARFRAGSC